MGVKAKVAAASLSAALALAGLYSTSQRGLNNIKAHEGVSYTAYQDPYYGWSVPTICYGHTRYAKRGLRVTQEQCDEWLKLDLSDAEAKVHAATDKKGILITQGEFDAYVSLVFNLGHLEGTPSVYGRLVKGDHWGACMGILKYYYSNNKPSSGLWKRRYAEYNQCISQLPIKTERTRG